VMQEQVDQLSRLGRRPTIDLRVLTFTSGMHRAARGAMTLLEFADPADSPVAYIESHDGARYLERQSDLERLTAVFDSVYEQAIPWEEYQ